jgi:hypothetical protein
MGQVELRSQLVSLLAIFQRKRGMVRVWCGLFLFIIIILFILRGEFEICKNPASHVFT